MIDKQMISETKNSKEEIKKVWLKRYDRFLSIILIVFIILFFIQKILCISKVSGNSMSPTYKNGQMVFVKDRNVAHIKRNDVILFRVNAGAKVKSIYIKRVVGIPGDTIYIHNGKLYVNDVEVNDNLPNMNKAGLASASLHLEDGEYFVLGDNRNNSNDSRNIGAVKSSAIIGIVTPNTPVGD